MIRRLFRHLPGALVVCFACVASMTGRAWADDGNTIIQRGLLPERDRRWSLGVGVRAEQSIYQGEGTFTDLVPLINYEGKRVYLRGNRAGLRLVDKPGFKLEAVAQAALVGYRGDDGTYLAGMVRQNPLNAGLSAIVPTRIGEFSLDVLTDVSNGQNGPQVTGMWARTWQFGKWNLRPLVSLTGYSEDYANYYYGVQSGEVLPGRPVYLPGASGSLRLGLDSSYRVSTNGYLYGSVGLNYYSGSIQDSPIVDHGSAFTAFGGYVYSFGNSRGQAEPDYSGPPASESKWSFRVARGWNAEASLLSIIPGGDFTLSEERTGVLSFAFGKLIDERLRGWPVDVYVEGAYTRYLEQDFQADGNGVSLIIKAYYYGFPWSKYVNTRFGFGQGLSWVGQIPTLEQRDLEKKNPNTSHLLCALDVSIDFSIGDLFRYKPLKDTYLGFAVIHRSGIFGSTALYGNVDGGSNYNSIYVQALF